MTDPHKAAWLVREENPLVMNDGTIPTAGVPDTLDSAEEETSAEEEAVAPEPPTEPLEDGTVDLNEMSVDDLKEYAKSLGITGYNGLKKAELVEQILDHLDGETDEA